MNISRGVRLDDPDSPEGDGEDQGANGQHQAAYRTGPGHLGQLHAVVLRCHLFLFRLHLQHIQSSFRSNKECAGTLEHLMGGMKDHLKEGNGHGEEHPDVDHLDVRGDRQALVEAQETKGR